MPVDNNQFSDTLNIKGRNNISQYCFLCFITRMDTEGKFPLSRKCAISLPIKLSFLPGWVYI